VLYRPGNGGADGDADLEPLTHGDLRLHPIERAEHWLLATSVLATLSIPIAVTLFEGTILHLVVAATAILAGSAFLWRTRGKRSHGKLLIGLAIGVSVAWLVGVTRLAISFAKKMENFN
jgi:hypothetical protein